MNSISKTELQKMKSNQRDFVLINVLGHDEFIGRHIEGSVNVPCDQPQFVQMVTAICADKHRDVVVYGADSAASTKAARKLEDAGFARVFAYPGGTNEWFDNIRSSAQNNELPAEHREWLRVVGNEPKPSVNEY